MRFILQSTSNFGRLGVISNIARLQGFEMETPHVLLHTEGGTVPHLTHEVLQMVTKQYLGLSIPVQSIIQNQEALKEYKNCIANYIGMKEYLTYCSFINPLSKETECSHYKDKIGFSTRNGRKYISAASYMEFIEDLKPDMFVLLADGWTSLESSKKRVHNSFTKSATLFEKCMDIYKNSVSLKTSQVLGAVEGGCNAFLREQASKLIGESPVFGVVIDGLLNSTDAVLSTSINDIQPFVEASLKHIPDDKLRIIHGCWNPNVVLGLIELGIDIFDTSYPTYITEKLGAFIFPNTEEILEKFTNETKNSIKEGNNDVINHNEKILVETEVKEPVSKKMKMDRSSKYHISLDDPCYSTDFTPINRYCTCLACKNHTKAYIHHLVSVKEMLGHLLLMIHNLHHYLIFFSTIRNTIQNGKFYEFKKSFQTWVHEKDDLSPPS